VSFSRATDSLLNNDNRQTYLRDGKTLKVVLCTKFCLLCDKQAIASALGQLRINFTCIFKVFQIALVASRLGQFCENLEKTPAVKLILNCPWPRAITYTNHIVFPANEEVTLQTCGMSRRFRERLRYTVELSSNQK